MKHLDFNSVTLCNFKSFVGTHTLDIERVGIGLHFIAGVNQANPRLESNGAGKSTLLDAIEWCLFGKTASGLRNPDVASWKSDEPASVELVVLVNDKEHCIQRSVRPNRLTLDGNVVAQTDIDALIGIFFDLFMHTVAFGQGEPLFYDLEPRRKMDLLSTVLSLDKWEERSTLAGRRADELENDRSRQQGTLVQLQQEIQTVESQYRSLQDAVKKWEADRTALLNQRTTNIAELQKSYEAIKAKWDYAELQYDGAMTEVLSCERELEQLRAYRASLVEDRANAESKIEQNKRYLAQLKVQHRDIMDKVCSQCGQPIPTRILERQKKRIKNNMDTTKQMIDAGIPNGILSGLKDVDDQTKTATAAMASFRKKADAADADRAHYQRKALSLQAEVKSAVDRQKELESEDNPHRPHMLSLRERLKTLSADQAALEKKIRLLGRRIERTRFWKQGFKEVRLFLIDSVLQDLEAVTNSALAELGLDGWSVDYAVERETQSGTVQRGLTVTITSPDNPRPVKWESWSGGEEQRLRLIGAMALSDVLLLHAGVTCSLLWLDEPSKSMTIGGVRDLCDLLAQRAADQHKQIFLVDHLTVESSRFSSVTQVVKTAKTSVIREIGL